MIEGVGDHGCEYMTGGRVVVIGAIGRNFAAGMSGGIAFVWDPEKKINNFLNPDMVELEELAHPPDIDKVLEMISRHKDYTDSKRAAFILSNWDQERRNFVKIIPAEYKMALLRLEEEKAERETEEARNEKIEVHLDG